jgi:ribosomal protein L3 glutamine methyltransferase
MTILELIDHWAARLTEAGVSFGHGTANAFDESAWLVLHALKIPLTDLDLVQNNLVVSAQADGVATLLGARISSRKPAAYLTQEAWLQGVPFYVDERAIVPRSLIAEIICNAESASDIDYWLGEHTHNVLDLCTGNGSLAVLAAMAWPDVAVDGADLSQDALAVARINVDRHQLAGRIRLIESDGMTSTPGPYDLIVCNPPYVNAVSMAALPAEYRAEPALALDGNRAGGNDGMDFVRQLLLAAPSRMRPQGVLVLEIGNEREHFERAFPALQAIWLETSAGEDQVLLLTRDALIRI